MRSSDGDENWDLIFFLFERFLRDFHWWHQTFGQISSRYFTSMVLSCMGTEAIQSLQH